MTAYYQRVAAALLDSAMAPTKADEIGKRRRVRSRDERLKDAR
jgi:hypothetical protein